MEFPPELIAAIEAARGGLKARELSSAYETLSARYRRESVEPDLFIKNETEALAYSVARLPATYAANRRVLAILKDLAPDFEPETLYDIGAGPGTAAFAAFFAWQESLSEALLVEPNAPLRSLGQRLLADLGLPGRYHNQTLEAFSPAVVSDLVLASYVLNEIDAGAMGSAVEKLWRAAGGALVLVETGTPLGYRTLLRARDVLLQQDAFLAAPCPHSKACPLAQTDNWCHFSVRVQRPSLHRQIKPGASLSYEDEKFAYLIATRREIVKPAARVIGAPRRGKVLSLPLCRQDGSFALHQTTRRDPDFANFKRLDWGDSLSDKVLRSPSEA